MSKFSKEVMAKAGIIPKLRLAIKEEGKAPVPTGPHTVKLIEDKLMNGKDKETGAVIPIVRYTFEEDGTEKRYEVPVKDKNGEVHYLVQRLSEVEEGQMLKLEMKKRGVKNYVSVVLLTDAGEQHIDDEEELEYPEDEK